MASIATARLTSGFSGSSSPPGRRCASAAEEITGASRESPLWALLEEEDDDDDDEETGARRGGEEHGRVLIKVANRSRTPACRSSLVDEALPRGWIAAQAQFVVALCQLLAVFLAATARSAGPSLSELER